MNALSPLVANRAVTIIVLLAIVMWSFGFPTWIPFTEAASLTSVSDTLSDSAPSVASNHTIVFTSPTGIVNGETVTITFSADWNLSTSSVDFNDIDVATDTDATLDAGCTGGDIGAAIAGQVLTLTFCSGTGSHLNAGATTTVKIGTNTSVGGVGTHQITNPGNTGPYSIDLAGTQTDSGSTLVAIIDNVVVTASVDTTFTFTVSGVSSGSTVNSSPTTTADNTTATTLPFGTLAAGISKTLAQDLQVTTNATNGFIVTVEQDQNLTSSTGADIDSFANDGASSTPAAWEGPVGYVGQENTYGHMGLTTEDTTVSGTAIGSDQWVGDFVGTPREVFYNNGPSDGATAGQGSTRVGYQVEITSLQEAGSDYTATLTYVATPTF